MKIINQEIIADLHQRTRVSERLRMNYVIHESLDEEVLQLLHSLQLGTTMPIHRYLYPAPKETFVLPQGILEIRMYHDDQTVTERFLMSFESGNTICEIMPDKWHSFEVLEQDTLIMKIKKGMSIFRKLIC